LYSDLIIILRLMTPVLMKILLKWKQRFNFAFVEWIKKLNLFKFANERTENDIKQQRTITRVYLLLLSSKITSKELI